jgi:hypothetical protein
MAQITTKIANMVDMLPEREQLLAFELIKRMVWLRFLMTRR